MALEVSSCFHSIVKLSFSRIDGLIGANLPIEAYRNESWWSNAASSAHSKGWLDAGWEVQGVNLAEGFALFEKVRELPRVWGRKKKQSLEISKPFTPVPVHPLKPKAPSKTKVSKLYARILNLERQRNAGYGNIKGFKPRSQYEKKLFGSDKKPH